MQQIMPIQDKNYIMSLFTNSIPKAPKCRCLVTVDFKASYKCTYLLIDWLTYLLTYCVLLYGDGQTFPMIGDGQNAKP